jgi:hypothetical protein
MKGAAKRAPPQGPHLLGVDTEANELGALVGKEFARKSKVLRGKHREQVGALEQATIDPSAQRRKMLPTIEQPDALRDDRRPSRAGESEAKEQEDRKMFEFGVGPDDIAASSE